MSDEITEPTVHLCWNDFAIRGAVQVLRAAHLDAMADDMEAQLKPAEPIEFASVVREKTGMLFVRTGALIRQPWESGNDSREWTELKDPEVLRVGIGEPVGVHEQTDAYTKGAEALRTKALAVLHFQLSSAITAERKDAYEIAIRAVEQVQP